MSSTFGKRLRLYMIGLGLGTVLSIAIFGKGCSNMEWAPAGRVRLRMHSTLVRSTATAQQELGALGITLEQVRASMDSAEVDFGASKRTDDSLYYHITSTLDGRKYRLIAAALRDYTVDSTATLLHVTAH